MTRQLLISPAMNHAANPYPLAKPRLRAAWQKGFDAAPQPYSFVNPYKWGTPCRQAFFGGYERRCETEPGAALNRPFCSR